MGLAKALVELKVTFNQAQSWLAPIQFAMILYVFLAAAYDWQPLQRVPYAVYILSGYILLTIMGGFLAWANRRWLVPQEYRLYGRLMGLPRLDSDDSPEQGTRSTVAGASESVAAQPALPDPLTFLRHGGLVGGYGVPPDKADDPPHAPHPHDDWREHYRLAELYE